MGTQRGHGPTAPGLPSWSSGFCQLPDPRDSPKPRPRSQPQLLQASLDLWGPPLPVPFPIPTSPPPPTRAVAPNLTQSSSRKQNIYTFIYNESKVLIIYNTKPRFVQVRRRGCPSCSGDTAPSQHHSSCPKSCPVPWSSPCVSAPSKSSVCTSPPCSAPGAVHLKTVQKQVQKLIPRFCT